MNLEKALKTLDPNNSDHWTSDGMPSLDLLKELTLDDELTREQITQAAPDLIREAAPEQEVSPVQTVDEKVNDIDNRVSELDQRISELTAQRTRLLEMRTTEILPSTIYDHLRNTKGIQDYLEAQKKLKEEKYAKKAAFLGSAANYIKPEDFDTRAKIDQSMSRKTSRGNNRPPVRGQKVESAK